MSESPKRAPSPSHVQHQLQRYGSLRKLSPEQENNRHIAALALEATAKSQNSLSPSKSPSNRDRGRSVSLYSLSSALRTVSMEDRKSYIAPTILANECPIATLAPVATKLSAREKYAIEEENDQRLEKLRNEVSYYITAYEKAGANDERTGFLKTSIDLILNDEIVVDKKHELKVLFDQLFELNNLKNHITNAVLCIMGLPEDRDFLPLYPMIYAGLICSVEANELSKNKAIKLIPSPQKALLRAIAEITKYADIIDISDDLTRIFKKFLKNSTQTDTSLEIIKSVIGSLSNTESYPTVYNALMLVTGPLEGLDAPKV